MENQTESRPKRRPKYFGANTRGRAKELAPERQRFMALLESTPSEVSIMTLITQFPAVNPNTLRTWRERWLKKNGHSPESTQPKLIPYRHKPNPEINIEAFATSILEGYAKAKEEAAKLRHTLEFCNQDIIAKEKTIEALRQRVLGLEAQQRAILAKENGAFQKACARAIAASGD